jgi:hypothetical protein
MAFGVKSDEFIYLRNYWEDWIIEKLELKLIEIQDNYEDQSIEDRETSAYGIEIDDIIYGEYCDKDTIHSEVFNTDRFWTCECEAIKMVNTPKEMLYITQYTEIKVVENELDLEIQTFHLLLEQFVYFFSKDLLYETCRLEDTILKYTDMNYDRYYERMKISLLLLNRKLMPKEISLHIREYIFSENVLERLDYVKMFNE